MKPWVFALIAFLVLDLFLVIWVAIRRARRNHLGIKQLNYIHSHWVRIIDSFEHDANHAILDADKLLDYTLGVHGFEGNVGEKLKKAKWRFTDVNGVWAAHKLRNKVAHELGKIEKSAAKRALKQFKKALNDLGANI